MSYRELSVVKGINMQLVPNIKIDFIVHRITYVNKKVVQQMGEITC